MKIRQKYSCIFVVLLVCTKTLVAQHHNKISETTLQLEPGPENPRNSEGDFINLYNGKILFAYTKFSESSNDNAPAKIMGRYSYDEGKTWTKKDQIIVEDEGQENVMSVSFLRMQNGDIAFVYGRKNSRDDNIPQIRISKNNGSSWSEPSPIITDQKGYFVVNNDRVIQLSNGRILAPVSLHKTPNSAWYNKGEIRCYFSDDNGRTWMRGQNVPTPHNVITQEPGIVELKNKKIMMIIRASGGFQYISYSEDRGITWSLAEKSTISSPISPASIERVRKKDDLVMVWNNNSESGPGYFKAKRSPLTIAISQDEGVTWKHMQNIEDNLNESYAYTAIEEVEGHLLLGYYVKKDESDGYALRIKRIKIKDVYQEK